MHNHVGRTRTTNIRVAHTWSEKSFQCPFDSYTMPCVCSIRVKFMHLRIVQSKIHAPLYLCARRQHLRRVSSVIEQRNSSCILHTETTQVPLIVNQESWKHFRKIRLELRITLDRCFTMQMHARITRKKILLIYSRTVTHICILYGVVNMPTLDTIRNFK